MTWRELWDFINNLPMDSATARLLHGEAARWTPTTHAVANIFDAYCAAHTEHGKKPSTYPRPEVPDN